MRKLLPIGLLTAIALASGAAGCAVEEETEGSPKKKAPAPPDPAVHFADAALEQCVRTSLGVPEGDILKADAELAAHLECVNMGIATLDGLEWFKGLQTLTLWENAIADLTPLAGLVALTDLQLGHNALGDLQPLAGTTSLRRLGLAVNYVADIGPLAGLAGLEWLNLDVNNIADAGPLG
ncbi:MAG: hypothetical protein HY744_30675, partial [Deltaproteobacteria bacterium]|nr:hypothetical protein [Deltaproteobacteria bacterium]